MFKNSFCFSIQIVLDNSTHFLFSFVFKYITFYVNLFLFLFPEMEKDTLKKYCCKVEETFLAETSFITILFFKFE